MDIESKNIERENEIRKADSGRKCPFDKKCRGEGNINEKYRSHSTIFSCPFYKNNSKLKNS